MREILHTTTAGVTRNAQCAIAYYLTFCDCTETKGFQSLFKVFQKNGIHSLLPRHVNQDSLEYFFGAARSVSSSNPSCNAFASAYKTLLLNNLMFPNSPGSNCEDMVEANLTSYKHLFQINPDELVKKRIIDTIVNLMVNHWCTELEINPMKLEANTYTCKHTCNIILDTYFILAQPRGALNAVSFFNIELAIYKVIEITDSEPSCSHNDTIRITINPFQPIGSIWIRIVFLNFEDSKWTH
ncbi:Uncharacterized protein FWK35_00013706 [Aphis craccivora]|uniref:Transposable element P transposase-like RNase H C-terminal domain-containing protein n=1 Tax=Aphis craccivora TaxID=307492 RepID=A0A6G0Y1R2_APHCR|nr:Uncharacterized protein FWK35_00013706 [Aphis craccivora]